VDPDYAGRYRTLAESHWWWRSRNRVVLREVRRLVPHGARPRILDVGCGPGTLWPLLDTFGEVEGVEPDRTLIRSEHADRTHVQLFDEGFEPGRAYHLILFLDVLEHLDDPVGALRHAAKLLAPGGRVLVTVPAFQLLWTHHDVINHHHLRYRKRTLRDVVTRSDLRVLRARYLFHWLFGAKLIARVVETVVPPRGGTLPAPPPSLANATLERWSDLEHTLLGPLRLPFGSSLLAVVGRPDAA
jgi:2-polyprenyl-3-methyl-5-hydroxy-6-metoxy-1,4-benzoquinol methylase